MTSQNDFALRPDMPDLPSSRKGLCPDWLVTASRRSELIDSAIVYGFVESGLRCGAVKSGSPGTDVDVILR